MVEELRSETPEDKKEQNREEILDTLELAFNEKSQVLLTDTTGNKAEAFIVGLENGILSIRVEGTVKKVEDGVETYVQEVVEMPMELDRIESVELVGTQEVDGSASERMKELQERADGEREAENRNPEKIEKLKEEIEGEFEKTPTKEEIFALLRVDIEKCLITKEERDDKGIKFLEFKIEDKEKSRVIEYSYARDIKSDERAPHFGGLETDIYETIYDQTGDFIKFPENIYRYKNGIWAKL